MFTFQFFLSELYLISRPYAGARPGQDPWNGSGLTPFSTLPYPAQMYEQSGSSQLRNRPPSIAGLWIVWHYFQSRRPDSSRICLMAVQQLLFTCETSYCAESFPKARWHAPMLWRPQHLFFCRSKINRCSYQTITILLSPEARGTTAGSGKKWPSRKVSKSWSPGSESHDYSF